MVNISNLVQVTTSNRAEIRYVCTDPAVQKAANEAARDGVQFGRSVLKLANEATNSRRRYRDGRHAAL